MLIYSYYVTEPYHSINILLEVFFPYVYFLAIGDNTKEEVERESNLTMSCLQLQIPKTIKRRS